MDPCLSVFSVNKGELPNLQGSRQNCRAPCSKSDRCCLLLCGLSLSACVFTCYFMSCFDHRESSDLHRHPEPTLDDMGCRAHTSNSDPACVCAQASIRVGIKENRYLRTCFRETRRHGRILSLLPLSHWTAFTKYRPKDKIIKKLNMATAEY